MSEDLIVGVYGIRDSHWYKTSFPDHHVVEYIWDATDPTLSLAKTPAGAARRVDCGRAWHEFMQQQCLERCERAGASGARILIVPNNAVVTHIPASGERVLRAPFFSFGAPPPPAGLSTIQVLGGSFVSVDGREPVSVYRLSPQSLLVVLSHLFPKGEVTCESALASEGASLSFPDRRPVAIVPSVARVSAAPLLHETRRSLFSPRERLEQTLAQVRSLRKRRIHALVAEGSELALDEIRELRDAGARVVLMNGEGKAYANEHANKSAFECAVMSTLLPLVDAPLVFKFGARYELSDSAFALSSFYKDKIVCKTIPAWKNFIQRPSMECILYSVPRTLKHAYLAAIRASLRELDGGSADSIETVLTRHLAPEHLSHVEELGIKGSDGIFGMPRVE